MEQNLGNGLKKCGIKDCSNFVRKLVNKFCSHKCYWKNKIGEKHLWGSKISESLKWVGKWKGKNWGKRTGNL